MKNEVQSDTNFKYWQKKADKRFFYMALLSLVVCFCFNSNFGSFTFIKYVRQIFLKFVI
jgi:hypothetical protein